MIKKIISAGQTGVEQAALDIAIKLGIAHGGWIPERHKTEILSDIYQLQVIHANYSQTTEQNVRDSDGTLIISAGKLTGSSALNRRLAEKHGRPNLYTDLNLIIAFQAAEKISSWIRDHDIEILNIAGPNSIENIDIYQTASDILETAFQIKLSDMSRYDSFPDPHADKPKLEDFIGLPKTVDQVVDMILSQLTFKEKTRIANFSRKKLMASMPSLRVYVKNEFRLWKRNEKLMKSYIARPGEDETDDVSAVIITELWEKLQKSDNVLRVVK
ncbi:putative molybdenum carrier protein [Desulfobacterales bacterium HSG2]|nr:putative molybdenum carrier protein [Desulfobacterales bacterium HSG2]